MGDAHEMLRLVSSSGFHVLLPERAVPVFAVLNIAALATRSPWTSRMGSRSSGYGMTLAITSSGILACHVPPIRYLSVVITYRSTSFCRAVVSPTLILRPRASSYERPRPCIVRLNCSTTTTGATGPPDGASVWRMLCSSPGVSMATPSSNAIYFRSRIKYRSNTVPSHTPVAAAVMTAASLAEALVPTSSGTATVSDK